MTILTSILGGILLGIFLGWLILHMDTRARRRFETALGHADARCVRLERQATGRATWRGF